MPDKREQRNTKKKKVVEREEELKTKKEGNGLNL